MTPGDINRRRVMADRHYGWEKATASQLGRIYGLDPRTVHAELRRAVCKVCRRPVCSHSDLEYAGITPAPVPEPARVVRCPPLSNAPIPAAGIETSISDQHHGEVF
jgi:hypothetical protein